MAKRNASDWVMKQKKRAIQILAYYRYIGISACMVAEKWQKIALKKCCSYY